MKSAIIGILLLSTITFAEVVEGTLHESDAELVDYLMEDNGIWDGRVKIVSVSGYVTYAVEFPGDYFSWKDEDDAYEIASVFGAVGLVSGSTSWHSDHAVCLYEDETLIMFTEDCRTVMGMVDQGYSNEVLDAFLLKNI